MLLCGLKQARFSSGQTTNQNVESTTERGGILTSYAPGGYMAQPRVSIPGTMLRAGNTHKFFFNPKG